MMKHLPLILLLTAIQSGIAFGDTPNDPYFGQQWYLHNDGTHPVSVDADSLHTIYINGVPGVDVGWLESRSEVAARATHPVTVAVIDSGIDLNHPELAGRIAADGYNFLKDNPKTAAQVFDDVGHGTHVAGIIAANADNGSGIAGIAPASVKILPIRVLSNRFQNFSFVGKLISDYAAEGIDYAVAHGATVINMSFGWPKIVDTDRARAAVKNALSKGVLIVAAAGNDRKNAPTYPCDYDGVLCVGAISNDGKLSQFSNFGGVVDLLAPGSGIISLFPTQGVDSRILRIQGYELLNGTSQAAPMVSAIAATLRSIYPDISLNELKSRLLLSGAALPSEGAALFGAAHLKRALDLSAQPLLVPDFKGIDAVEVDEQTLSAHGQFTLSNLWQKATDVSVSVSVNGVNSGDPLHFDSIDSNSSVDVPWSYQFQSLDDSALVHLKIGITSAEGSSREFSFDVSAVRQIHQLGQKPLALPPGAWIDTRIGKYFSLYSQAAAYPVTPGVPPYWQIAASDPAKGTVLNIFDASSTTPFANVQIPEIAVISRVVPQLIRIDANLDGKPDWVVAGLTQKGQDTFFEFYFMDGAFKPLYGSAAASTWKIAVNTRNVSLILRDYSAPGSWVKSGDRLIPSFMANGTLPDPDNYRPLSELYSKYDTHFYYLLPQPMKAGDAFTSLVLRALDNKAFRDNNPGLTLINIIRQDAAATAQGRSEVLLSSGNSLRSKISIWTIRSIEDQTIQKASHLTTITANGQAQAVLSGSFSTRSAGYLNFFDEAHGSFAWLKDDALSGPTTQFGFEQVSNPVLGFLGAIDLGGTRRTLFVESQFDMVAVEDDGGKVQTLPIERDSSFPMQAFSELFTPVVVGAAENPSAGLFIDSTLVRGNQVSVALVDPQTHEFRKPLRYSLEIPNGCAEMAPFYGSESPDSFQLPLFCVTQNGPVQFQTAKPY